MTHEQRVELRLNLRAAAAAIEVYCEGDGAVIEDAADRMREAEKELEFLSSPPPGYPECTSAIVALMAQEHGMNVVRIMHANQQMIGRLTDALFSAMAILQNDSCSGRYSPQEQEIRQRWNREILDEAGVTMDWLVDEHKRRHPEPEAADHE
jgi:hypothetical protein